MIFFQLLLLLVNTISIHSLPSPGGSSIRIASITDVHIGESCGGDLSYNACKPVRTLQATIEKINANYPKIDLVVVTGDLTSSAIYDEFLKIHELLQGLNCPWFPLIGNHDIWSYNYVNGQLNQTSVPTADSFFAEVFKDRLSAGRYGLATISEWPTSAVMNQDFGYLSYHHNFIITFPELFENFYILNLDWVARQAALPFAGVGPQVELHDYPGGTFQWLEQQLQKITETASNLNDTRIFIYQHHPFHNRDSLDPYGENRVFNFTFDDQQDKKVEQLISKYLSPSQILGVQAGHNHRWFNGTAFTRYTALDDSWRSIPEFEIPACKAWAYDQSFTSAFSIFHFQTTNTSKVVSLDNIQSLWVRPNGEWQIKLPIEAGIIDPLSVGLEVDVPHLEH